MRVELGPVVSVISTSGFASSYNVREFRRVGEGLDRMAKEHLPLEYDWWR